MNMGLFSAPFRIHPFGMFISLCLCTLIIGPAAGADVSIEAYLGETITLHGVSYVGDTVYLFLTGPNLPADGVTLTDVSQRADQGHFTIVPVDNNQEWSYNWQTSRIDPSIDPGTYTVYVTNEPVDLSQLGGSGSYKTLSVFLKDSGVSKVSVNAGRSYTLRPESHTSTVTQTPFSPTSAPPSTLPATPIPPTTLSLTPVSSPSSPTKAGIAPFTSLAALLGCSLAIFLSRNRQNP
jgi:hypothetical protein